MPLGNVKVKGLSSEEMIINLFLATKNVLYKILVLTSENAKAKVAIFCTKQIKSGYLQT